MSYYKELSRLSKKVADGLKNDGTYYQAGIAIDNLCESIETLLAERDALLDVLRGSCGDCVHYETKKCEEPCIGCYHAPQHFCEPPSADSGLSECWQWRGAGGSDGM